MGNDLKKTLLYIHLHFSQIWITLDNQNRANRWTVNETPINSQDIEQVDRSSISVKRSLDPRIGHLMGISATPDKV